MWPSPKQSCNQTLKTNVFFLALHLFMPSNLLWMKNEEIPTTSYAGKSKGNLANKSLTLCLVHSVLQKLTHWTLPTELQGYILLITEVACMWQDLDSNLNIQKPLPPKKNLSRLVWVHILYHLYGSQQSWDTGSVLGWVNYALWSAEWGW